MTATRDRMGRLWRSLGVHEFAELRSRAREVEVSLAENARLDAVLARRIGELEQIAARIAANRLRERG